MPRLAKFRITAIGELCRQLLYAPPETRRRHMQAAETLAGELDPSLNYPEDFVIFRVTSYRPDSDESPVTLVGEVLVGDLAILVERLSRSLTLNWQEDGREAVLIDDIAKRLNVSTKTIQRYRKQGLVCHYVTFKDGVQRLACFNDVLKRYVSRNPKRLSEASKFTRVSRSTEKTIIDEARILHQEQRLTLSTAAEQLAKKYNRAHETIRSLLHRHDKRAAVPIFSRRGPLTSKDAKLIYRAFAFGIPTGVLAKRFAKTRTTVNRAANEYRAQLLRPLDLSHVPLPMLDREDAESVILGAGNVIANLSDLPVQIDAIEIIEAAHVAEESAEQIEQALIAAINLLKRRAATDIVGLAEKPSARVLDAIETDLRWATMIKAALIIRGLPASISAIEQALGRSLAHQPSEDIRLLLGLSITVAGEAVAAIDLSRGQRLAHTCGFMMDRALAFRQVRSATKRAASRYETGSIIIDYPFVAIDPWQIWLDLRPDLRQFIVNLDDDQLGAIVTKRYGISGNRPMRISELANEFSMTTLTMANALNKANRKLHKLAQKSGH